MNNGPDRLALLRAHPVLTGIDYVTVGSNHDLLEVVFHNPPSQDLQDDLTITDVTVAPDPPDGVPAPAITAINWAGPAAHRRLRILFAGPGPFAPQRLTIAHGDVDPFFGTLLISFKAGCPSPFDCAPDDSCPPEPGSAPLISYLARDFDSYRQLLLDYAETHWPNWSERHAADFGVMMLEVMAALGDELAYYQDRISQEAYLPRATQPRSLRSHARLVAHDPVQAEAGFGWVVAEVNGAPGAVPAGTPVWAQAQTGERIPYTVGHGLSDALSGAAYGVDAARNALAPHIWDEDDLCLLPGTREIWLAGALAAALPLDDATGDGTPARRLFLVQAADPAQEIPFEARIALMIGAQDDNDPLTGGAITRITLSEPLATPLWLPTLTVHGNLLPVTPGETQSGWCVAGRAEDAPAGLPDPITATLLTSIERQGGEGEVIHRIFIPGSDEAGLVWRGGVPDIALIAQQVAGGVPNDDLTWDWRASLVGAVSSLPESRDFTLEEGRWDTIRTFRRPEGDVIHRDYASPFGHTIRFGNGEFGAQPARGTLFRMVWRLGGGVAANVGARVLTGIGPLPAGLDLTITNPLPIDGGRAAETPAETRIIAPEAWRQITYRAVRPEDYAEAAMRLDWVENAAAISRWTGSWLTVFTTPDPRDTTGLSANRRTQLEHWLDQFRQTGRDSRVSDPIYADLDLELTVCATRGTDPSALAKRLQSRLSSAKGALFDPNTLSFGTGIDRSDIVAAVHEDPGVRAVERIRLRRRGWFDWRDMAARYAPEGPAEIIRIETDRTRPERGAVTILVEGGL
ncbi:hypothetical protein ACN2XU_09075 [Primorskyibacter sp. 2E107]|uniref:hypothetical protein n=1 Tax=Primorskyibacter sp. 2E107 TaxID=3403458 RepID=UPI003AF789E5